MQNLHADARAYLQDIMRGFAGARATFEEARGSALGGIRARGDVWRRTRRGRPRDAVHVAGPLPESRFENAPPDDRLWFPRLDAHTSGSSIFAARDRRTPPRKLFTHQHKFAWQTFYVLFSVLPAPLRGDDAASIRPLGRARQ